MPVSTREDATRDYARLLLKLHELDPRGENESAELDAICDQMEGPWSRMGGRGRKRMKGLSRDLYALADGRRGVPMSPEERGRWGEKGKAALLAGDPDAQLEHLRGPFPEGPPPELIAFLQAQCWVRLGELDVAVVFLQAAGKVVPTARLAIMEYLRQLGRGKDAAAIAEQLIGDPHSRPLDLYLAAGTLFLLRGEMEPGAARVVLERIVPTLKKVLASERGAPLQYREFPELELSAARALGFTLDELGRHSAAVDVCTEALQRYPNDAGLLLARGFGNLQLNPASAESDFERAVVSGLGSSTPYLALAWFRLKRGDYLEVLALTQAGLRFSDLSSETQALLWDWRGISLAMLGQPRDWVEEAFDKAAALDPASGERIGRNRQTALGVLASRPVTSAQQRWNWSISSPEPFLRGAGAKVAPNDLIPQSIRDRVIGGSYADLITGAP